MEEEKAFSLDINLQLTRPASDEIAQWWSENRIELQRAIAERVAPVATRLLKMELNAMGFSKKFPSKKE